MINFDDYVNENETKHNKNWPYIPAHLYRILIVRDSGFGKTSALLNLIENQPEIGKIYLYFKDPYEAKYQYLIKIREKVGIYHHNNPRAYTEYSNDMGDVYKNINYYNPDRENKILIVFHVWLLIWFIKKARFNSDQMVYWRKEIKYFYCFYYPIIL